MGGEQTYKYLLPNLRVGDRNIECGCSSEVGLEVVYCAWLGIMLTLLGIVGFALGKGDLLYVRRGISGGFSES